MASEYTYSAGSPVLAGNQAAPPLVLLNTPMLVAAYSTAGAAGLMANARTVKVVIPLLDGVQDAPPFTLL